MITHADRVKLFMTRFNCVCKRMKKAGWTIEPAIRTNYYAALGLNQGWSRARKIYTIDVVPQPVGLMLQGRLITSTAPLYDLETHMGLYPGCLDPFNQGFSNSPTFYDVWEGLNRSNHSTSYWQSLMFNIGRAFLKKFTNIELPYGLPKEYYDHFKKLG